MASGGIDDESEDNLNNEDNNTSDEQRKASERCGKCRRLKLGHPRPFGKEKCELERINDDKELENDDGKKIGTKSKHSNEDNGLRRKRSETKERS